MSEISSFKDLGIAEDEFEIELVDEEDGAGCIGLQFKTDVAAEIFRAACERAGLSQEQYLRRLFCLQ
jgi:hypothetical protein